MQPIKDKVISRIYGHGMGWCFTPRDFSDLGSPEAVRIALYRLTNKKVIRRLAKGLYDYPKYHEQLGLLSPDSDVIARALTHRDAIRIQPTGAYAANLLGLSEQVPARVVFLTDGAPRRIRIGNREIILRRTTPRNMAAAGRISGLVIQAFRYIGKDRLTEQHTKTLKKKLSVKDKKCLAKDMNHAPAWMHRFVRQIIEERPNDA